jgi:hypothetical protein
MWHVYTRVSRITLFLGLALAGATLLTGQGWLPQNSWHVRLFSVWALILVPSGLVLGVIALVSRVAERSSSAGGNTGAVQAGTPAALAAAMAIVLWVSATVFVSTPLLALPATTLVAGAAVAVLGGLRLVRGGRRLLLGRTAAGEHTAARGPTAAVTQVTFAALLVSLLLAGAAFPALSRALEWGRYGFPPPVRLRDLDPITEKLGLRVPSGTEVVRGWFTAGPGQHLYAVLHMPAAGVDSFLHKQAFQWDLDPGYAESDVPMPSEALQAIRGRSPVILGSASVPRGTDNCWVAVDLSPKTTAVVYLYWVRTIEDWDW